ncbi:hypothetical protein OC835_002696 [Tilletia horrida]|uniref:Uncharacterized protein n=1 Tax=Tilletia horrida TaxID=155126 RepID=A0AAN6GA32_9BASI|nr:hypothetical protein OC842_006514 [Tilletia horrida]KAK0534369.1 hypothetical protein OC835_002696 [Tilletia horrida]KAK0558435.1 hypothetical protein OC844_005161 [Tilletia horrida]
MSQPTFAPISNINEGLHAFHVTAHDRNEVTSTYHYCACLPPEKTSQGHATPAHGMRQCLLYSDSSKDAKLIGVEFLLEEADFLALDEDEKKLWHSHQHEVESGLLCALAVGGPAGAAASAAATVTPAALNPGGGIPNKLEKPYLEQVYKMYGKIFHFYTDVAAQAVPTGAPTLMMSTTRAHPSVVSATSPLHKLVEERDAALGVNTAHKAAERVPWITELRKQLDSAEAGGEEKKASAVVGAGIAPGADQWEKTGSVAKVVLEEVKVKMENTA